MTAPIRNSSGVPISEAVATLERAITSVPPAELPSICADVERLRASVWLRIATLRERVVDQGIEPTSEDRYLTMEAVELRTGLSKSYLYQLARIGDLPVTVMGRGRGGKGKRAYRVLLSDLRL